MTENGEDKKRYYVVVDADDLGRSSSVNSAILKAHRNGIVTSASLMAGGEAFEEAVEMTRGCNALSVGLHVTLCDGRPVLKPSRIPGLVDREGRFEKNPAKAWINCMRAAVLPQVEAEVDAQFDRLERAGVRPTHVDGHHHLQMHPGIFEIICRQASKRGVPWIRLANERLATVLNSRSFSRGFMPAVEWAVFGVLRGYNLRTARRHNMNVACLSLGLAWTGSIDENSLGSLVKSARGRVSEVFTHPDDATESGLKELRALTSGELRKRISSLGMELVGYRELSSGGMVLDSACGNV